MERRLQQIVTATRKQLRTLQLQTILEVFNFKKMLFIQEQQLTKYAKMCESLFLFFRGSTHLYYYDITNCSSPDDTLADESTWIIGHMYMDNSRAFQNKQGELVYEVNELEKGYVGSYTTAAILTFLNGYPDQLKDETN